MQIEHVGIIGLGLMGHGIAQVAAQGGFRVTALELDPTALETGVSRIEKSLDKFRSKMVEKGEMTEENARETFQAARGRISPTLDRAELASCDLIIEAIVEDLSVKRKLFAELGSLTDPKTILASNTSSFPIVEMAEASGRPERTIGLHFFNPVQLMKLVEVVRAETSSPEVIAAGRSFAETCGKTPIDCKDTPGFVVNRLLVPFISQALLLLERGDATMEDIDTAMQLGCGHPMGPITLADYVGLDTSLSILQGWCDRYPNEPIFAAPKILREKVEAGKLGRKTGEGFYRWDGDKKAES